MLEGHSQVPPRSAHAEYGSAPTRRDRASLPGDQPEARGGATYRAEPQPPASMPSSTEASRLRSCMSQRTAYLDRTKIDAGLL